MKGYITQEGLVANSKELCLRFGTKFNAFLKKLSYVYKPKVGPPKGIKLYKYIDNGGVKLIVLPRSLMKTLRCGILDIEVALPPKRAVKFPELDIDLYNNQKLIVDKLMTIFTPARINDGSATALLNLRAGFGKTFIAAAMIEKLSLRTLYVVPKRPLMVQAVKDLKLCLKNNYKHKVTIGGFMSTPLKRDQSTDHNNQDVTVIVIDSAILRDKAFFAGYSMVIFDEVHTYCSDTRKKIFKLCSTHVMFGMSATTNDRKDGFDVIAHKELAYDGVINAEDIPGFQYEEVRFNCDVTIIKYNGPSEYTKSLRHESTGMQFTPYMNKQFLSDPYRNELVLKSLRELYDWRGPDGEVHCIYVFCEEVKPLQVLYMAFRESFGDDVAAPEITDVAQFVGGISNSQITSFKEDARILLTTYGYGGTGVSIDKMTAIVFLTPRRANMKQILARILRGGGNRNITRRVIDVVDNKTSVKSQLADRMNGYNYYGMNVKIVKLDAPSL